MRFSFPLRRQRLCRAAFAWALAAGLSVIGLSTAAASSECTVVLDSANGQTIHRSGPCAERVSPASSFKVALALMGFASGELVNAHEPVWHYRPSYEAYFQNWRRDTDPQSWLRDSVVWYSQELTSAMGLPAIQGYLKAFDYGNQDFSGDPGRLNGLTHAWLSSSLLISADEQADFMRRIQQRQLPLPEATFINTEAAMTAFPVKDGWVLHGKTGSGRQRGADGALDANRQFGWFVGWATNGERSIAFARLLLDDRKMLLPAGYRARDEMLADLPQWLP